MKNLHVLLIAVLTAASALSFSGCASRTDGSRIEKGKLWAYNPVLATSLEVVQDAGKKTPEGMLRVQVRVINKNSHDQKFQYRFKWLDEDGMTINQISSPWMPMVLHGTEVHELEGVSGVQGADDFRLEVRQ